jgi:hypothetical protein
MARDLILERGGRQSRFGLGKVDRIKLYGQRRRIPLDPHDQACERAELTADGSLVLRATMTAQAYFDDDGVWVPHADLVSLTPDGRVADKHDSTLGVPQPLESVDPSALLDTQVNAVYALDPEDVDPDLKAALDRGEVFRFPFNYRAGSNLQNAFLVANPGGVFALIGQPVESDWCELARPVVDVFEDDAEDDDDLDFEMF